MGRSGGPGRARSPIAALTAAAGAAALCGGLALPAAASTAVAAESAAAAAPAPAPTSSPTDDGPTSSSTDAPTEAPATAPTEAPAGAAPEEPAAASGDDAPDVGTPPTAPAPDPALVAAYEAAVAASAEASARLAEVSARAAVALEARDAARARHDVAVAERAHQEELAATAATAVAQGRSAVGRWASSAYRGGEDARGGMPVASALLGSATTDQVGSQLSLLAAVGRQRTGAVRGALDAEHVAAQALARAAAAEEEAVLAQQRADVEAAAAESALAEQRELAAAVDAELAAAREQLGVAVDAARAAADLAAAAAEVEPVVGAVDLPAGAGGCASSDVSGYPNGQIPVAALCPLETAAGHLLRADAARSFDAMSRSYEVTFGTPLCVTDSYRSLAGQIAVRASKPELAAVPGTSRHGLGRAVDLCGGVEDFGSVQHEWVVQRAPLFGWFHPSWADEGGSKPEAWHFEYAESAGGSGAA
ncbi:D-alanyl-D-alanine carboxypeptidase family protein [uncultured Pseudokineococcus sp.]|uniref:M15 family metallopeptidase n=1 Tax=uncultured Pseudokineococcus sp. TaxID=1642928 RepID=UPI00261ECFA6|nr:M15 family metallopeptidase [uncultured Pseudokineococcus sp.]